MTKECVTISVIQYIPAERREAIEKYLEQVLKTKPIFVWVSPYDKGQ